MEKALPMNENENLLGESGKERVFQNINVVAS